MAHFPLPRHRLRAEARESRLANPIATVGADTAAVEVSSLMRSARREAAARRANRRGTLSLHESPLPEETASLRAPSVWAQLARWVLLPAVLLIIGTLLLSLTGAELALSKLFYDGDGEWPLAGRQPWLALYVLGPLPGLLLGIGGLVVAVAGYCLRTLRPYRTAGLFLALALAVGPGLLVNGIFKPCWGRPRPCQTSEFGGNRTYLPCWQSGPWTDSMSFPSGHASMGFFLMIPAFWLYRRDRRLAAAFVVLGLAAGGAIGLSRIVQGRHFASDVLWSLGCVYFTGLGMAVLFRRSIETSAAAVRPTLSIVAADDTLLDDSSSDTLADEPASPEFLPADTRRRAA